MKLKQMIDEINDLMTMIVTNADKYGNIASRDIKKGFKNRITGKPLYEINVFKKSVNKPAQELTAPFFFN